MRCSGLFIIHNIILFASRTHSLALYRAHVYHITMKPKAVSPFFFALLALALASLSRVAARSPAVGTVRGADDDGNLLVSVKKLLTTRR